ncbi:MAG: type II toxin-antitoxin system RelB/DinJ family antitoxin [Oscillospiraceae bacterium]|nr:type II toxin-antitoxin system RelB/DinJ family antitoxin [Oscillospiraceae bacterium]
MATKAITVRIEFAVKKQAEAMLEEMGLDMPTYIIASVKSLVREKRIPFEMVTAEYITDQAVFEKPDQDEREAGDPIELVTTPYITDRTILEKLAEAGREAKYPNTTWLSHEDVFEGVRERYGYEI